jgi:hypothetical protein
VAVRPYEPRKDRKHIITITPAEQARPVSTSSWNQSMVSNSSSSAFSYAMSLSMSGYEAPVPGAEGIADLMCFYPERGELTVGGEPAQQVNAPPAQAAESLR